MIYKLIYEHSNMRKQRGFVVFFSYEPDLALAPRRKRLAARTSGSSICAAEATSFCASGTNLEISASMMENNRNSMCFSYVLILLFIYMFILVFRVCSVCFASVAYHMFSVLLEATLGHLGSIASNCNWSHPPSSLSLEAFNNASKAVRAGLRSAGEDSPAELVVEVA